MELPVTREGLRSVAPDQQKRGTPPSPGATGWQRRIGRSAVALVIALAAYLAAFVAMRPIATGDEPHYMLEAHSLAHDLDRNLRDEYADARLVQRYYPNRPLDAHAYDYRKNGRWVSIHNVGLPLVLAPVARLGGGLLGARLFLILVSTLVAHQLFLLLWELHGTRRVWLPWAAVCFSLPLLMMTGQIYPDVLAALLIVVGIRCLVTASLTRARLLAAGACAAALPWLHVRYLVLTAALAAAVFLRAVLVHRSRWAQLHRRRPTPEDAALNGQLQGVRLAAPALILIAVSGLALALLFQRWYGSPSPSAPYHPSPGVASNILVPQWSAGTLYRYSLGAVLSPSRGILPFAPVLWLGVVGTGLALRQWRAATLLAMVGVSAYAIAIGGLPPWPNLPGRFLVPVVPLLAVPLLLAIGVHSTRALFYGLLPLSFVLAAVAVHNWQYLHTDVSERTRIPVARGLQDAWPDFAAGEARGFILDAAHTARTVGSLVTESTTGGKPGGAQHVVSTAAHGPGVLAYGAAPLRLRTGTYIARYLLGAGSGPADAVIANVEVVTTPEAGVVARREVRRRDLAGGGASIPVELPFQTNGNLSLGLRVLVTGVAEVRLHRLEAVPDTRLLPPKSRVDRTLPDWPMSLLWVAGTFFVALLLTEVNSYERESKRVSGGQEKSPA